MGQVSSPLFSTVASMLRHHALHRSTLPALEFKGSVVTYDDLSERMYGAAKHYKLLGVSRGDRVAYLGRNSALYYSLFFGCAATGSVFVPLNWRLAAAEIDEILQDCQPAIIFVDRDFSNSTKAWQSSGNQVTFFSVDPDSGDTDIDALFRGAPTDILSDDHPESAVVMLYTSGTTGRAKGVQLSHRSLLAPRGAEQWLGEWSRWNSSTDKLFAVMPLFHIGCLSSTMMAFYQGCCVFIMDNVDPDAVLVAIGKARLTHGLLVPTLISAMLRSPQLATSDLSSLKLLLYGGSPISSETLVAGLAQFRCQFVQGYGMTEVGGTCIFLTPEEHDPEAPQRLLSIGKSGPMAQLEVRDGDGSPLPDGKVGEIWIDSVGIMNGYWNRPDEDDAVMKGLWYRSGDAGYRDTGGYFYLTDRFKDMIVTGGENVYPAEVERALSAHPALLEVAVIGVPHDKWGESVHAIAVLKPGHAATAEMVMAFARSVLGGFKVPKSVDFVEALPRNAFGKIPKYVLREPYWAGRQRRIG